MDFTQSILAITSGLAVVAAAFERYKSQRANARAIASQEAAADAKQQQAVKDQIIAGKDELCKIARDAGDAWKTRYDEGAAEFARYRTVSHERANEAQALVLRFTAENAELRNKTDISPILEHQRLQSEINGKVVQALDQILLHFQRDTKIKNGHSKQPSVKLKP